MSRTTPILLLYVTIILALFALNFNGVAEVSGKITIPAWDFIRYNITQNITVSREIHIVIRYSSEPVNICIHENNSTVHPGSFFWIKDNVTEGHWQIDLPYSCGWTIELQNPNAVPAVVDFNLSGPIMLDSLGNDVMTPFNDPCCCICVLFPGMILLVVIILYLRRITN